MIMSCPDFPEGGCIPEKHTCDGQNMSPLLEWEGAPAGTRSYALIMDDPDAPRGTWVHWVIYNIPHNAARLPESLRPEKEYSSGTRQGLNSWNKIGYGGPCPPKGAHRYVFHLFALDGKLDLPPGATKDQLVKAMKGHILAEARYSGRYARRKPS